MIDFRYRVAGGRVALPSSLLRFALISKTQIGKTLRQRKTQ
jgi:hypothetical protein